MMNVQNGQILTVNPMGVFIGCAPTTTYNGYYLAGLANFNRGLVNDILEIQVMQSDVEGKYGMPGNPTPCANGYYTWMRIKTDSGVWSDWLCRSEADGLMYGSMLASIKALTDTFILASTKRRDFRAMIFSNLIKKEQQMFGRAVSKNRTSSVK